MNRDIRTFIIGVNNVVHGEGNEINKVMSANFDVIAVSDREGDFKGIESCMREDEKFRRIILNESDKYDYIEAINLECFTIDGEEDFEVVDHIAVILKFDDGDYIVECVENDFRVTTTVALCS